MKTKFKACSIYFLLSLITTSPAWAGDINSDLLKAAYKGNTTTVEALLSKGADINAKSHSRWTALMYAASRGNLATTKVLLDKGADIEIKDLHGYTALMLAVLSGHRKIVQVLLYRGANFRIKTKNGDTALRLAKEGKHKKIFVLLKRAEMGNIKTHLIATAAEENKSHNDIKALFRQKNVLKKIQNTNIETRHKKREAPRGKEKIKIVSKTGAVAQKTSPTNTIYSGWFYLGKFENEKIKWTNKCIKGYEDRIPKKGEKIITRIPVYLRDDRPNASKHKNTRLVPPYTIPEDVELIVKNIDSTVGVNGLWIEVQFSNDDLFKPIKKARKTIIDFLTAVKEGKTSDVLALLKKHPNINARCKDGMTALILAARNGYTEIVRILLDKGADVNAEANDGWTALMTAAWKGHAAIVQILLEEGADINERSNNRWTALLASSKYGYLKIVKMLMAKGADIKVKNREGKTAMMLARARGHAEIVRQLRQYGAKE